MIEITTSTVKQIDYIIYWWCFIRTRFLWGNLPPPTENAKCDSSLWLLIVHIYIAVLRTVVNTDSNSRYRSRRKKRSQRCGRSVISLSVEFSALWYQWRSLWYCHWRSSVARYQWSSSSQCDNCDESDESDISGNLWHCDISDVVSGDKFNRIVDDRRGIRCIMIFWVFWEFRCPISVDKESKPVDSHRQH